MKQKKQVLIVGGGMAGMAAARTLGHYPVTTHLVEQKSRLGGHAAMHACMATHACQRCSACKAQVWADQLTHQKDLSISTNTSIETVTRTGEGYQVVLASEKKETLNADAIILATGFTPSEPAGLLAHAYQVSDRILSTYDLNQILKQEVLDAAVSAAGRPRIGFVQCVGSRNREIGKGYCSQVCCDISRRQIEKILHLMPHVHITLFYIDLQMVNPAVKKAYDALSERVELIQGVPFEVFTDKEKDKISVIHEHDITGQRTVSHLDLLVLSVGISASDQARTMAQEWGLPADEWGFVNEHQRLAAQHIFVAGCAAGPADIVHSELQGIQSAEKAVKAIMPAAFEIGEPRVAVVGDQLGSSAVPVRDIRSIRGTAGHFTLCHSDVDPADEGPAMQETACDAVIIKYQHRYRSSKGQIDLSDNKMYDLEAFDTLRKTDMDAVPRSVLIRLDMTPPSKTRFRAAVEAALELAGTGREINIIFRHMLVNAVQGQALYDRARRNGVTFFRVDTPTDVEFEESATTITWRVKEKTIKGMVLSFETDCLILPEYVVPDTGISGVAEAIKDRLDDNGYISPASIWNTPALTMKKGIYALPPDMDAPEQEQVMAAIHSDLRPADSAVAHDLPCPPVINTAACKKCLTCFRVCPHGAIELDNGTHPAIQESACQSCGVCMASCPALAIDAADMADTHFINPENPPRLVVFACQRSGFPAANGNGLSEKIDIQKVPCVCRISRNLVLKTFETGVRKIILAGCHPDNCKSEKGPGHGRRIVDSLRTLPGLEPETLDVFPVAANESHRLTSYLNQINSQQG